MNQQETKVLHYSFCSLLLHILYILHIPGRMPSFSFIKSDAFILMLKLETALTTNCMWVS